MSHPATVTGANSRRLPCPEVHVICGLPFAYCQVIGFVTKGRYAKSSILGLVLGLSLDNMLFLTQARSVLSGYGKQPGK